MTAADLDGLLRSEGNLEEAVRAIAVPHTLPPGDREAVRAELQAVGRALVRCRRLGRVLVEVVGVTLEARGEAPAYGRRAAAPASYGQRLNATG